MITDNSLTNQEFLSNTLESKSSQRDDSPQARLKINTSEKFFSEP